MVHQSIGVPKIGVRRAKARHARERSRQMSEDEPVGQGPRRGRQAVAWAFKHFAGPAEGVQGAMQGGSAEARELGSSDLAGPQALQPGAAGTQAGRPGGRRASADADSAVGVARARGPVPAAGPRPGRRGRAVDVQLAHHVVADLAGDPLEQRAGEQPQLGGPGGRLGPPRSARRPPASPGGCAAATSAPTTCSQAPKTVASAAGCCQPRAFTSRSITAPSGCGSRGSGPGPE